jgi:DNA-3-methyladenine glycosylase II
VSADASRAARERLRAGDPVLRDLIDRHGPDGLPERRSGAQREHYGALVRTIVGQQLSTKAAAAIYNRLAARFGGREPTPREILDEDPEALRGVGLSRAKVTFLRSLAEHVLDGRLELERLDTLSDEEVIGELTAVRGLGPWSAHMFLMFHLDRPDVLATGDLGIRKAMMAAYALDALPDPETMERIAAPWRPYRTLACRYLWATLDSDPGAAEPDPI